MVSFKGWSRLHGTRHLPGYIVAILFRREYNFANHSLKVKKDKGKVHPRTHHEGLGVLSALGLTSAVDGGGWSTPLPGLANLDECGISRPHRVSIPGRPFPSESLYRLR